MRKISIALVVAVLGAGCEAVDVSTTEGTGTPATAFPSVTPAVSSGPTAADGSLAEQIASLPVAGDRGGYDRDDFGDYDRDAVLEASLASTTATTARPTTHAMTTHQRYTPTILWRSPKRGAPDSPNPTPTPSPKTRTTSGS